MGNKLDMRIMPIGTSYKFYGRCYYINEENYEIETDVKIDYAKTLSEILAMQQAFVDKNIIIEDTITTENI